MSSLYTPAGAPPDHENVASLFTPVAVFAGAPYVGAVPNASATFVVFDGTFAFHTKYLCMIPPEVDDVLADTFTEMLPALGAGIENAPFVVLTDSPTK